MKKASNILYGKKYGESVGSERGFWGFRSALRTMTFLKLINPKTKEKILEIGCNNGLLLSKIKKRAPLSIGVDVNQEMVKKLNNPSITYMSATELQFPANTFDTVCAFDVIEHITEIKKVFQDVYTILKNDGKFIISIPFEIFRGQSAVADALRIYHNPFMARKLHVHKLNPKIIQKIIDPIGFESLESKLVFIPFPAYVMTIKKN